VVVGVKLNLRRLFVLTLLIILVTPDELILFLKIYYIATYVSIDVVLVSVARRSIFHLRIAAEGIKNPYSFFST
jgi:hypothetical protein